MIAVGLFIFSVLYIWSCTNSLNDLVVFNLHKPIKLSLKILDYAAIVIAIITIIGNKEVLNQYQQFYGLMILLSVLVVTLLSYVPCNQQFPETRNLKDILNRSLLCPQYSIRSYINLVWYSVIGMFHYGLPIILRRYKTQMISPISKAP